MHHTKNSQPIVECESTHRSSDKRIKVAKVKSAMTVTYIIYMYVQKKE